MPMTVGVGGPAVMTGYVTDKATGQRNQFQGTNMADILRQAGSWKPKGSAVGNASQVSGPGGAQGLNFGSNNSGNSAFQNASMQQSQQIQAARNGGAFGGTANQVGKAQTAFNTVPQANTNVQYPMGGGPGGAAPMYGSGLPGSGGSISSLLQQQQAENKAAADRNRANVQAGQQGVRDAASAHFSDAVNQGTRGLVTDLLNNPEALNDRTANSIRNRQSNQIRSQTDNQFERAVGQASASGDLDANSMSAMRRSFDRQGAAQTQNANQALDVTRANQRNADMQNAIGAGQRQAGMDSGVRTGAAGQILASTPQELPEDLSGWIAAMGNGGGAGGNFGGGFNGGVVGGGGSFTANGGDPIADAGFSSTWTTPKGFSGPKGPSTFAGFDSMFDTRPADAYAEQKYYDNKVAENARMKSSWDSFAAAKPTAYGNPVGGAKTGGGMPLPKGSEAFPTYY